MSIFNQLHHIHCMIQNILAPIDCYKFVLDNIQNININYTYVFAICIESITFFSWCDACLHSKNKKIKSNAPKSNQCQYTNRNLCIWIHCAAVAGGKFFVLIDFMNKNATSFRLRITILWTSNFFRCEQTCQYECRCSVYFYHRSILMQQMKRDDSLAHKKKVQFPFDGHLQCRLS